MLNRIFQHAVVERKNRAFLAISTAATVLLCMVGLGLTQLHFFEVLKSTSAIVPEEVHILSLNHDALIDENNIVTGQRYKQQDTLLKLNTSQLKRDQAHHLFVAESKQKEYDRLQGVATRVDLDAIWLDIKTSRHAAEQLKQPLSQVDLLMPYDGLVIHSDISRQTGGFMSRGRTVAQVAALDSLLLRMVLSDVWIEKVQEGDTVTVKTQHERLSSVVSRVWVEKTELGLVHYADIALPDTVRETAKPGTILVTHIITEKLTIVDMLRRTFR